MKRWRVVADHIRHQITRARRYGNRNKVLERLSRIEPS
jgi:hypothetical protein